MDLSPYQKVAAYFGLLCLLGLVVVTFISLFITHAAQPALSGSIIIVFMITIGATVIGFLRLKADRQQGHLKHWYQQPELTSSVVVFCMILMVITVGIITATWEASTPRYIHYLELIPLIVWAFFIILFILLTVKSRREEEKK